MVNPMKIYIIPLVDEIWSQPLRETGQAEQRDEKHGREHHMVKM